jgi:hypothetical protein
MEKADLKTKKIRKISISEIIDDQNENAEIVDYDGAKFLRIEC